MVQRARHQQEFQQAIAESQMTTIYEEIHYSHISNNRWDEVRPPKTKKMKIKSKNHTSHKMHPKENTRQIKVKAMSAPMDTLVDSNEEVPNEEVTRAPTKTPPQPKTNQKLDDNIFAAFRGTMKSSMHELM